MDTQESGNTVETLMLDRNGQNISRRVQIAIAHLLWETAHIDGYLHPLEQAEILHLLRLSLKLTAQEARQLQQEMTEMIGKSDILKEHLAVLNETYSAQQREHLFSFVCRTALADRLVHKNESALVSLFSEQFERA